MSPPPQTPSSGPAAAALPSASAAAATPTSTAPNSTPTASRTPTSVRIAGVRRAPPRGRGELRSGRQPREAGWTANAAVAPASTRPASASAAPVDHSAPMPSASGGPKIQVSSLADASTA